jgi:integrase
VQANPVPRGLLTRRAGGSRRSRTAPLVRVPRILSPGEADRLVGALRTHRDRAMVLALLLARLRHCEVLGLQFADVQLADRRLAVVEGRAAITGSSRRRTGSSPRWAITCTTSGRPRRRTGCS